MNRAKLHRLLYSLAILCCLLSSMFFPAGTQQRVRRQRVERISPCEFQQRFRVAPKKIYRKEEILQRARGLAPVAPQAPLVFQSSAGQADEQSPFIVRSVNFAARFTPSTITAAVVRSSANSESEHPTANSGNAIVLTFKGASLARLVGQDAVKGSVNSVGGRDHRHWLKKIPSFNALQYHNLYPGVQALVHADTGRLAYSFLLVRRAVETIDISGTPGGAIKFACTFHAAPRMRFVEARMALRLTEPPGVTIHDVAPREVRENEPVRFRLNDKGKLSLSYAQIGADLGQEHEASTEFAVYHCTVKGSGENTALARWDFTENPHKQDGIGHEQVLALTVPVTGRVTGSLSISARLVRPGLKGAWDAIRDMVIGNDERSYPVSFTIPPKKRSGILSWF
jgi:hypothetical protein